MNSDQPESDWISAEQSIVLERPLAAVFALGCDLARRCQWQRGTLAGELCDPDVAELGARCTETRKAQGDIVERWELEIIAFERNSLLVVNSRCDRGQVVERHRFAAELPGPGHTRYTLTLEAARSKWKTGELQRQILDRLIHFRDCVESPDASASKLSWLATRVPGKARWPGRLDGTA